MIYITIILYTKEKEIQRIKNIYDLLNVYIKTIGTMKAANGIEQTTANNQLEAELKKTYFCCKNEIFYLKMESREINGFMTSL